MFIRKRKLRGLFDHIYGARKFGLNMFKGAQHDPNYYIDPDLLDIDYEELGISAEDYYKLQDIQSALGQDYLGQTKKKILLQKQVVQS